MEAGTVIVSLDSNTVSTVTGLVEATGIVSSMLSAIFTYNVVANYHLKQYLVSLQGWKRYWPRLVHY